jgi:hypothetical protein
MSVLLQAKTDAFSDKIRAILDKARAEVVQAMDDFYDECDESEMSSNELERVEEFTSTESPLGVLAEFLSPSEGAKLYEALGLND